MGDIVKALKTKPANIVNFVETGTGLGFSANAAFDWGMTVHTIEADDRLFKEYINKEIHYYAGWSTEILPKVLKNVSSEPTLFFLDAHYFGSDFFGVPYDSLPLEERCPARAEFEIIKAHRDISNDIFLFDDLRIYKKDIPNVQAIPESYMSPEGDSWMNLSTHNRKELYSEEGYVLLEPIRGFI